MTWKKRFLRVTHILFVILLLVQLLPDRSTKEVFTGKLVVFAIGVEVVTLLASFIIKKPQSLSLLLDIVERGGIHHFLVQCGIQHTAVFPGRYKIRSQESKDHDDSQEDHGIQRMEFEFTFLLFRHLIPLLYRSLLLRCSRPPG